MNDIENVKCYLAMITFDYGMGSYAYAPTAFEAIEKVKKQAESDFDSMLIFGDTPGYINVYDYTNSDGWYTTGGNGPKDKTTKEFLPFLYTVSAKLKNSAKTLKAHKEWKAKQAAKNATA
jgi:hypothetical protein